MASKEITLTPEELAEIKEDAREDGRFKEKVLLELKLLRGIPNKVIRLRVEVGVQWAILLVILTGLVTKALRLW